MSRKTAFFCLTLPLLVGGCQHLEHPYRDIVLHGFSDRNYAELNSNLGGSVCIYGRLSIDSVHHNVHFPLRPIQDGDVVVIGYSRILPGLNYDYVRRNGMVDGESYRVCGTLRDATPFRRCDHDRCKWYELQNAELRWNPPQGIMATARGPMSYEACATSRTCVVHGVAAARLAEHASTAQFNLPDGRCINVSLPRERLEHLRRAGPVEMTVTGEVYRDPSAAGEDTVIQIDGRTIGFGLCGDFFVFVPDRQLSSAHRPEREN